MFAPASSLLLLLAAQSPLAARGLTAYEFTATTEGFELLNEAIVEAELVDFFNDTDPLTLFAPTNASFEAYLYELGANSISDISGGDLLRMLLYQTVTNVAAYTDDLSDGQVITTASGNNITILKEDDGTVNIADATSTPGGVVDANITVDNGVIHVTNKVLLSDPTVVQLLANTPNLSKFYQALEDADLINTLTGEGPFTVFAPANWAVNNALAMLGINSLDDLPTATLQSVLLNHIVKGEALLVSDLTDGEILGVANGQNLTVHVNQNNATRVIDQYDNAGKIIEADAVATNGVIQTINYVLGIDYGS